MKSPSKKILGLTLTIVLALILVATIFWFVATTRGSSLLLNSAASLAGVSFSAGKIEGRLIDRLLLAKVRVGLAQQQLAIERVELRWEPILLLAGRVAVQELVINGVLIQDNTPLDNKPPVLEWPRAPEMVRLFDGVIARFQGGDIRYRRLQEQPVFVTSISASMTWQDGLLSVMDLDALSPSGRTNGSLSLGLIKPSFTSDLAVVLVHPLGGMDGFHLKAGESRDSGPEPYVGTFSIAASSGSSRVLEVGGDLGMARNVLNMRRLHMTRPGQKGSVSAEGSLAFPGRDALLSLQVKVVGLDLAPDLNLATDLSGNLRFEGNLERYHGEVTFVNRSSGWQSLSFTSPYQGTMDGLTLAPLTGRVLEGALAGTVNLSWRDGFNLKGLIRGRNLNPARIDPAWKGVANFNADLTLAQTGALPLTGSVSCSLLDSRLHGQILRGELQAELADNNLSLGRLDLQGKGFNLQASGELNQRLDVKAEISDFSRLIPGTGGTLRAEGWVRRQDSRFSGALTATGRRLAYAGVKIASARLTARLAQAEGYPVYGTASLGGVEYDMYRLNNVTVSADGTLGRHTAIVNLGSAGSQASLGLAGGYTGGVWKGEINRLAGKDSYGPWKLAAPASFSISSGKLVLLPLVLTGGQPERLEVAADLNLNPLTGQTRALWTGMNLSRVNPYLKGMLVTGRSHGSIRLGFQPGNLLSLTGSVAGSGTFTAQGHSVTLQRSNVTFDGSGKGVRGGFEFATPEGGRFQGSYSSPDPLRFTVPERGELTGELNGINLELVKHWLPRDMELEGVLSGRARGVMLPGRRFELDGSAAVSGGRVHQKLPEGELNLTFPSANASWGWRGETLSTTLSLTTADNGQAKGNLQLPVPARFPLAVNPKGALGGSVIGQVREKGVIAILFPGTVQESSGELDGRIDISGSWETPQVGGTLRLAKGGAYLPTAGIHLKDVQLLARLEKNLIRIDSYRVLSGQGHMEGTALITLAGRRVTGYQGTIKGEKFQAVNFPELQVMATPDLNFVGTPEKLILTGELRLPEMHIIGNQSRGGVAPSSDVVREGVVLSPASGLPLVLDARIRLVLGDRVFAKAAGIDARLGGTMDLAFSSLDTVVSRGQIDVLKGSYRTYGVNLEIVRGRLFFPGGAIDRPSLDFLALTTIGNIRAGVTVTGTLQKPITKLYSEPTMPDLDILAYIVLGHTLGSSGEKAGLLSQAAGALLTSSQAMALQEQIKNRLGLSSLEIQGGVGGTPGHMGYKQLTVTPPGTLAQEQQPGLTETVLTLGKYLTPQIYVSYGRSLFTGSNLFRLRYDISKKWQIETQTGSESGADLFYKLEFK